MITTNIYTPAVQETLSADLWSDGLFEVSNTDSVIIASASHVPNEASARMLLEGLFGQVGTQISLEVHA